MKKTVLLFAIITCINVTAINAQRIYNVSWGSFSNNVKENEDIITNTSTSSESAVSNNQTIPGETGYLQFSNFQTDKTKSIGIIKDGNTGPMDYFFSFVNNQVSMWAGTTLRLAAYTFNKGDKFSITISSTSITFLHNGIVKTYCTFTNSSIFRVKAILASQNSSFAGIKTSIGMPYSLSPTKSMNYIQTISPLQAVSTITVSYEQRKTGDYLEKTDYFDGLGRNVQTVNLAQSPMLRDVVQPTFYNNLGLKARDYLPYTVKTSSCGTYQSAAINTTSGDPGDQKTFMQQYFDNPNKDYKYGYNDNIYESSPLNRIIETVGTGADWKGKLTDAKSKSIKYDYGTNNEDIMLIRVDEAASPVKFYIENKYSPGSLLRTSLTDENGNQSDEFKDVSGRVLLKRSYIGTKKLSTYYVYDLSGLLRLVIQPKGSASLESTFPTLVHNQQYYISDNILFNHTFYYAYDGKERMTTKILPGQTAIISGATVRCGTIMVYNSRDQLVLTQDGNLTSQNKWKFIKYDVFNRPIMTGIYSPGSYMSQAAIQNSVYAGWDKFETRNASLTYGYTTDQTFPKTNLEVETVTCYDDYNYPGVGYTYINKTGFVNAPTTRVDGKVTAQKIKVLGTNTWITTVNYYDEYGRVIQSAKNNLLSGTDVTTIDYTFSNQISHTLTENLVTLSGPTTKSYALKKRFVYDNADRLIDSYEQVNSEAEVQLSRVSYNENQKIKEKNLHSTGNIAALQSIDYTYNIRGWLSGINNTNLDDGEGDLFGMNLMYNDLGSYATGNASKKQYNGNIAATEWTGKGTNASGKHGYVFTYDGVNRLLNADYYKNSTLNHWCDASSTYDENGNLLTFKQSATKTGGSELIDDMNYVYNNESNQIIAIGDAATDVAGRGDFSEASGYNGTLTPEFFYDNNGNMTEDKNRGIKIVYNELNLPATVTTPGGTMAYTYDATGNKLRTTINGTTNRYYMNEMVYSDNDLLYIATAEGRIRKGTTTHLYEYNLKDHLGNTRVSFGDNNADGIADLLQEDHYYPFGEKIPGYSSVWSGNVLNKTLYNGKELQEDISGFGMYDYGHRFYDAQIGRFTTQDAFAEKYYSLTSYQYAANNPLRFIDYNGDSISVAVGSAKYYYYDDGKAVGFHDASGNYIMDTKSIDPYLNSVASALGELGLGQEGSSLINELAGSNNMFSIENSTTNEFIPSNQTKSFANIPEMQAASGNTTGSNGSGGKIHYNPNTTESGFNTAGNRQRPAFVGLAHEMFHGRDANQGVLYYGNNYTNTITGKTYQATDNGLNKSEWRAVYYENIVRGQAGIPLRTNYGLQQTSSGGYLPLPPRLLDASNNPINYTVK